MGEKGVRSNSVGPGEVTYLLVALADGKPFSRRAGVQAWEWEWEWGQRSRKPESRLVGAGSPCLFA